MEVSQEAWDSIGKCVYEALLLGFGYNQKSTVFLKSEGKIP